MVIHVLIKQMEHMLSDRNRSIYRGQRDYLTVPNNYTCLLNEYYEYIICIVLYSECHAYRVAAHVDSKYSLTTSAAVRLMLSATAEQLNTTNIKGLCLIIVNTV